MGAIGVLQFAHDAIDPPAEEAEHACALRGRIERRSGRAPQHGANAGQQFARIERLRQIVVGAHFQTDDAVDLFAFGGQHDDRNLRVRAQPLADAQAVFAGQHQVEHDKVDPVATHDPVDIAAVANRCHPAFIRPQVAGDERADLTIVFDEQNVRRFFIFESVPAIVPDPAGKIVSECF